VLSLKNVVTASRERCNTRFVRIFMSPFHCVILISFCALGDFFLPAFQCPHRVERIGRLGDGGKYVCGIERIIRKPECVVYSIGRCHRIQIKGPKQTNKNALSLQVYPTNPHSRRKSYVVHRDVKCTPMITVSALYVLHFASCSYLTTRWFLLSTVRPRSDFRLE
jgi:hypothetical protein